MNGTEGYRIEGLFDQNEKKEAVVCKYKNGKKEISCAGLLYEKQADHIGKYAAVMIAPDDIEMINEGSEIRRKFIDSILCQCDTQYFEALLQYQKVLQQRNAWLKMYSNNASQTEGALLDYYNELLSSAAAIIFSSRNQFLVEFAPLLQEYYTTLSSDAETAKIQYHSDIQQQSMAKWLDQNIQNDLRYQRTLRGIHKDDLYFLIDENSLKNYGSQGQKKSFLFALKLAQFDYLQSKMHNSPILLLDDLFEKLDQQRMEALLHIIRSPIFKQVIMTDTHESRVRQAFGDLAQIQFINL